MRVYMMQHGEAASKEQDPERSLTTQGAQDVARVAQFLRRADVPVQEIWHSGKRRAEQTASIVAGQFQRRIEVKAVDGLSPNAAVEAVVPQLRDGVLLAGHLPFLSRLISCLVVGNPDMPLVKFQTGGVVCLLHQDDAWQVAWMVLPNLLV